jgi:hypothetical protein
MRSICSYIGIVAAPLVLLCQSIPAQAQSWKPICVNGGATGGAHNGTWQKVNTNGTGGGTWKRAGGCAAPTPPQPPVPVGNPFTGYSFDPAPFGSNPYFYKKEGFARVDVKADGTWGTSGGPAFSAQGKPASGQWRASGYSGSDFEVSWTFVTGGGPFGDYQTWDGILYQLTSSSPQGTWTSMDNGWWANFRQWGGDCYPDRSASYVTVDINIRYKRDPSMTRYDRVIIAAHGYDGNPCG